MIDIKELQETTKTNKYRLESQVISEQQYKLQQFKLLVNKFEETLDKRLQFAAEAGHGSCSFIVSIEGLTFTEQMDIAVELGNRYRANGFKTIINRLKTGSNINPTTTIELKVDW